jgi:hypothetical protein
VVQSGTITPHNVPKVATQGRLMAPGGLFGDAASGRGLNPFSITTGSLPGNAANVPGLGLCAHSDLTTGPHSSVCLGHDAEGHGILRLSSEGLPNRLIDVNGMIVNFPPVTFPEVNIATAPTKAALEGTIAGPNNVTVLRLGRQADAPPLAYTQMIGTCSANLLVNDGGNCVNAADSNSWLARWPAIGSDVLQWGADPTGATNSNAAFAAAAATSALTLIPAGTYSLTSPVATTTNAWLQDPTAARIPNLDMRRGLFRDRVQLDGSEGSNIWRFADKIYIDGATNNAGNFHHGGSWLTEEWWAGYMERASSLVSISSYGGPAGTFATRASDVYGMPVWQRDQVIQAGDKRGYFKARYEAMNSGVTASPHPRHLSEGTLADGGGVLWRWIENTGIVTAPIMALMANDIDNDASARYGMYLEVMRYDNASVTFGAEWDIKNLGDNVIINPFDRFGPAGGATMGLWLAGGGGDYGGTGPAGPGLNPSSVALAITRNSHTWNTGISFTAAALTGTDGITGSGEAIAMAKGHQINWYASAIDPSNNFDYGVRATEIRSDVTDPEEGTRMRFINNGFFLAGREGGVTQRYFQATRVPGAVNLISVLGSVSGVAPRVNATGEDEHINLILQPKGDGHIQALRLRSSSIRSFDRPAGENIRMLFTDQSLVLESADDNGKIFFAARRLPDAVNYPNIAASISGQAVSLGAVGDDENINIRLSPKGAGIVRLPAMQVTAPGVADLVLSPSELGIARAAASGIGPGGLGAKIAVVCGASAGTARLIAYAGTSGTPTTVIDNIGSGVSGC